MESRQVERFLTMGQVASAQGVRGGLRVNPFTDPPEALLAQPLWRLESPAGQVRELRLLGGDCHRGQLRVRLEGVTDRDQALGMAGWWVKVARDALPAPADREYYRDDLAGFAVTNEEGAELGSVSHFVDLPGGPVMVVRGVREHWVPAVPKHLRRVDLEGRRLTVDWPDDL
jgi:16S rRNA processing protein RimM